MSRASEKILDGLHEAVASVLTAALKKDDVSPQMIAQAIKFLSTNGINTPAKSKRMTDLQAALEDLDVDEVETHYPH